LDNDGETESPSKCHEAEAPITEAPEVPAEIDLEAPVEETANEPQEEINFKENPYTFLDPKDPVLVRCLLVASFLKCQPHLT
jgi:hypothetical protein